MASRAAIVTGGGYGIGRATCRLLADDGWAVLVVDRDEARARETEAIVTKAGGTALAFAGDVADPRCAPAAVARARERLGPVKGLATCAAMRHAGPITAIDATQWDETVKVVLYGTFHFCHAVIPEMIANGGGAIVTVSSPDSYGRKDMVAYAAAKGAVNSLTLCLAADHLQHHIRVNAVLPGFTLSGMTEHYPEERLKGAAARSVAGRAGLPEDSAGLIRYLMSDAGETFTGGIFGGRPLAAR